MSEKIIQLNEEEIKSELKEHVRGSVEEALNELSEKEAESLTQAARYERSEVRQGYRSGHYNRKPHHNLQRRYAPYAAAQGLRLPSSNATAAGRAAWKRRSSKWFWTASRCAAWRVTEALWGSKVSSSSISELNKKAYVHIEEWRNRPL